MIKIKIFSSFGSPNDAIKAFQNVYGMSDKFEFVNDDSYTHVLILNTAMPQNLKVPKKNVIGLAFEPPQFLGLNTQFIEYAKKNIGRYHIGETKINNFMLPRNFELSTPFLSRFGYMWFSQEIKNYFLKHKYEKKGVMSIWCSTKKFAPGHRYRHQLIEEILKTDLPIDIYGKGTIFYDKKDKRIRGGFSKDEPYKDYKFCVSIENFVTNDYISEKYMNCVAYDTVPIYLGARNLEKYFGENSCIRLSGDLKKDMNLLKDVIYNSEKYEISLEKARYELFEGRANFNKFIEKMFIK